MKLFKQSFLLVFIFSYLAYSQHTDKGVYILSGQVSYTSISVENVDGTYNYLSIDPLFAYFVANNLAIGGTLRYYNQSHSGASATYWGIGPAIAYYINTGNVSPFVMASYVYSSRSSSSMDDSSSESDIILGFGTDFFLSKNVSIQPLISYDMYSGSMGDVNFNDQNTLKFGIGIGVYIY